MATNNYYLPATGSLGSFDFNSLGFGQSFVNIQDNSLSGLGFQNWSEVNYNQFGGTPDDLVKAKDKAVKAGDRWWEKALSAVLVYGVPIIAALVSAGVLKNKNTAIADLSGQNYNKAAMESLINSGGLNLKDEPRETEIFGIKTSTLILIGAGLLIWVMFKPEKGKRRK